MVKSPRSRGHRSWDTNETGRASWTSLMSNTEQDISSSCQRLDQIFKNINWDCEESDHVPNPISIVRRLAALETAIGQLKQDCETVDEKRRDIVQSVMADQIENIQQTKEMLSITNAGSSLIDKEEFDGEPTWIELSHEMKTQLELLNSAASVQR